ncbi:MAG: PspC domain-containing protein [Bacteroidales bacterium]|nr:PspC domain-containing protein [Bacteroidales bacterium]
MDNSKRLQRNTRNKVIAGVCSGLADFFGIDVALMRVIFILLLVAGYSGFLIYLILWIVMPKANHAENQSYDNAESTVAQSGKGSWIAGVILIAIGTLCLLDDFLPKFDWSTIWPVLLIVLGLLLIVPFKNRKS